MLFDFRDRDAGLSIGIEKRFQKYLAFARDALGRLVFSFLDELVDVKIVRSREGEATGEQEVKKNSQRPNVDRGSVRYQSSQHLGCSIVQ